MEPPALLSGHVSRCLTCQAEAARSRRVTRVMALMGVTTVPAPPELMPRVEVAAAVPRRPRRRSEALVPAIAAASATAVAGAIAVLVALRRRAHAT